MLGETVCVVDMDLLMLLMDEAIDEVAGSDVLLLSALVVDERAANAEIDGGTAAKEPAVTADMVMLFEWFAANEEAPLVPETEDNGALDCCCCCWSKCSCCCCCSWDDWLAVTDAAVELLLFESELLLLTLLL